jgi:hypothetical protein
MPNSSGAETLDVIRVGEKNRIESRRTENHPGRPHCPTSVIGRSESGDEDRIPLIHGRWKIIPAAHTAPHRLSAGSGEKMNQIIGFANRQPAIAHRKSTGGSTGRWLDQTVAVRDCAPSLIVFVRTPSSAFVKSCITTNLILKYMLQFYAFMLGPMRWRMT